MVNKIIEAIKKYDSIAIITHKNPDGDALGSAFMLEEFIKLNYSKTCSVFSEFEAMDGVLKHVCLGKNINKKVKKYDLVFVLDCGDTNLLGKYKTIFLDADYTICIDHHKTNSNYAQLNCVECLSSNCEYLYSILKQANLKIDKNVAKFCLVGILTDTNNLSTNSVTANTYKTVAELNEIGADVYNIRKMFFAGHEVNKFKIISLAMHKAELLEDNTVAIIKLTKKDFFKCGLNENDTVGIINTVFGQIKGLNACFLWTPRNKMWHISMRANDGIDVSVIAESLGGGGHIPAAACNTTLSYNRSKQHILKELKKQTKDFLPKEFKF